MRSRGTRRYRRKGPTTLDLAGEMITATASWLPRRAFSLCAAGAYASLARRGCPRTTLASRTRRGAL
jgi:hypothetical protein